jgi:hypothetical protein
MAFSTGYFLIVLYKIVRTWQRVGWLSEWRCLREGRRQGAEGRRREWEVGSRKG